jgi:heptosyltransferase-2
MWFVYGHEVDANMKILLILGWDGRNIPNPCMAVDKVDFPAGKYIGISAGYGDEDYWKIKNWGHNKYAELIKLLLIEYPGYKVLILGKGKDRKVLDHIKSDRVIDCVDKYTIRQSAYIVSLCDFMVANDTGLGHIASAIGIRIYSIFGATSRIKNRPYKNGVVIAREDLDCAPCQYTHRWPGCKNRSCMNMSVKEVFNAIKSKQKKV